MFVFLGGMIFEKDVYLMGGLLYIYLWYVHRRSFKLEGEHNEKNNSIQRKHRRS